MTADEQRAADLEHARVRAELTTKAHEIRAELDVVCKRHGARLGARETAYDGPILVIVFDSAAGCDEIEVY
jgi:hypothetical protein